MSPGRLTSQRETIKERDGQLALAGINSPQNKTLKVDPGPVSSVLVERGRAIGEVLQLPGNIEQGFSSCWESQVGGPYPLSWTAGCTSPKQLLNPSVCA